jgi:hypothetical protein
MSNADTSIEITGEIKTDADLSRLVAAIVKDRPTPGWSDPPISGEDEAISYVRHIVAAGTPLIFAENERDGESFPSIQTACHEIGLAYLLTVSVDEEYDDPGRREVWNPIAGKLERHTGVDGGLVEAKEIHDLLTSGRNEEAMSRLRSVIEPRAGLPTEFTVAPGLIEAPALRP